MFRALMLSFFAFSALPMTAAASLKSLPDLQKEIGSNRFVEIANLKNYSFVAWDGSQGDDIVLPQTTFFLVVETLCEKNTIQHSSEKRIYCFTK